MPSLMGDAKQETRRAMHSLLLSCFNFLQKCTKPVKNSFKEKGSTHLGDKENG